MRRLGTFKVDNEILFGLVAPTLVGVKILRVEPQGHSVLCLAECADFAPVPEGAAPPEYSLIVETHEGGFMAREFRPLGATPTNPTDPKGKHMTGLEAIAAERQRQMTKEGWTLEHDDTHTGGELAEAAACYAASAARKPGDQRGNEKIMAVIQFVWPDSWDWAWWKPKDRRADLVRAGALIAAEIDRLDRAAAREVQGAFACLPRHLVEAYREARAGGDVRAALAAAVEIAEAALDDVS